MWSGQITGIGLVIPYNECKYEKYIARENACNVGVCLYLLLYDVYLKVGIGHTFGDLFEQRLLNFLELRGLDDIQNLLNLTQKHHLIGQKAHNIK